MAYRFTTPPELVLAETNHPALEAYWQPYGKRPYLPAAAGEGLACLSEARAWAEFCEQEHRDVLVAAGSRKTVDTARLAAALAPHAPAVVAVPSEDPGAALAPAVFCEDDASGGAGLDSLLLVSADSPGPGLWRCAVPLPAVLVAVPVGGTWGRTGLNALARAFDALMAAGAFALTDTRALGAVRTVFEYLPLLAGGEPFPAGEPPLLAASLEAGLAARNAGAERFSLLGVIREREGGAQPGWGPARALQDCLCPAGRGRFQTEGNPALARTCAALGRAIGSLSADTPDFVAAEVFRKALADLCRLCGLPASGPGSDPVAGPRP